MSTLLSVAEARTRLLASFSPLDHEAVELSLAAGRVLAEPVLANFDLPSFANSSMDGFAVRSIDVMKAAPDRPVTLKVVADIPAGHTWGGQIQTDQAARIMTGAPVPEGADAVIPVEEVVTEGNSPGADLPQYVTITKPVQPSAYIRPRGMDVTAGEVVLPAGVRIRPQELGFLAMLGVARVMVYRKPRVAVLSTGDELVPLGQPLAPGKIHDSNTYTLIGLIEKFGAIPLNLGIAADQEQVVRECLDRAVDLSADLILSSAGVSVGAFDFVRSVIEQSGGLEFWRVNMRPGKPLAFGSYRSIPFIGLPGNPVSAFVGFEVFVRPSIRRMEGLAETGRALQRAQLLEAIESDGRESYLRAVVEPGPRGYVARLTGHQGSGNLRSLVQANALLLIPSGVKSLPIQETIDFWFID